MEDCRINTGVKLVTASTAIGSKSLARERSRTPHTMIETLLKQGWSYTHPPTDP